MTILATAACLGGWLAGSAQAAPASAGIKVAGRPVAIAADVKTHTFWVAESRQGQPSDIVDKITEAGHKVTTLHVTSGIAAIAADSSRGMVWAIGNSGDGATHTVTFIKESTDAVSHVTVAAGSDLTGLAIDQSAGTIFVLDDSGDVFTLSAAHPKNAPVRLVTGGFMNASGLAVDPATGTLWVLNPTGNSVFAFSESTGDPIGSPVSVGNNPDTIAVDTARKTVWVGGTDAAIFEFAEASPGTVHTVTLDSAPVSVTTDPSRGLAWVGSGSGTIYEISGKTAQPALTGLLTLPAAVDGLTTDPGNNQLWATEPVTGHDNVVPFAPTAPAITSRNSTWFARNNPAQQSFPVRATAFPPAHFSLSRTRGSLRIGKLTGILTGTLPSGVAAVKVTITASNGIGKAAHQTFTLHMGTDPAGISNSATFAVGVQNTFQVTATGNPAPTFRAAGLPRGLTLSRTGVLSGSLPKGTKSPVTFMIKASNSVTEAFGTSVTSAFTLMLAPGRAPKITSPALATFRHGRHGSFTVQATGFPTPSLGESGKLPSGLKFAITGGGVATISGTPANSARGHTYKVKISASNGVGKGATQTLTIKVT